LNLWSLSIWIRKHCEGHIRKLKGIAEGVEVFEEVFHFQFEGGFLVICLLLAFFSNLSKMDVIIQDIVVLILRSLGML